MKRYPAYDPPEYADWKPDAGALKGFRATLAADPKRAAVLAATTPAKHLALYSGMLRNRLHDIALKRWVKQGVISKAWLGTGEEAEGYRVLAIDPETGVTLRAPDGSERSLARPATVP